MKTIIDNLKIFSASKANKHVRCAIEINDYRLTNLSNFGMKYKNTFEYKKLLLAEKMEILKYEIYKSIFKL